MNSTTDRERNTPVFSERLASSKPRFNAAAFFAQKDRLSRLCVLITLAALIVAGLALKSALSNSHQKTLFVVLDPAGNVIVAPGVVFSEAKELHVQQAMLATTAVLLRNPKDFDQPEILQSLFSRNALTQASALKSAEAREFQERQIQQKPQITRIDAIATRQEEVQIQVSGQLFRAGIVQQTQFSETVPFTLRLVLKSNLDLLHNRRQPTLVKEFLLTYETPHP